MASDRGSSLDSFVDFTLATRQKLASSVDELVSQASNYRTFYAPMILKGNKEMFQGGTEIVDFVQLSYQDSFAFHNFTDTYTFNSDDSLTKMSAPWRLSTVNSVTHEAELDLQQGGEEVVFKRVKKVKMAALELSFWEGMERAIWGDPDFEKMEAATLSGTGRPYSLRCFVTTDGLAPTSANGGVAAGSSSWTSLMGIDPSVKTKWKNQFETFDNTSATTRSAEAATGLIPALDRMWLKTQYQSPETLSQYVESTKFNKQRICGNLPSIALMTSIARGKNNVLTPSTDLGYGNGKVVFHGIPMDHVSRLDNIDTDVASSPGGEATAQDGAGKIGYRYRFLNLNNFKIFMHPKHYRRMRVLDGGVTNPNAKVMLEDTWWNLWCSNRRENGIVSAAA